MSTALAVGVLLALACLAYVLYPLVGPRPGAGGPAVGGSSVAREVTDDEIEAAIRSYRQRGAGLRACATCGPRPESDALYCSSCGRRVANGEGAV